MVDVEPLTNGPVSIVIDTSTYKGPTVGLGGHRRLADVSGVLDVGAAPTRRSDVDDTSADSSNFGDNVDQITPGVCVLSTCKGGGYDTIPG